MKLSFCLPLTNNPHPPPHHQKIKTNFAQEKEMPDTMHKKSMLLDHSLRYLEEKYVKENSSQQYPKQTFRLM